MSVAIGIDLGTTNTVVAAVVDGVAVTLEDEQGRRLLPSVVSFHPSSTVLVGEPARERRLIDPENTIFSVKPLLGRSWESDEVKAARSKFPFQLVPGAKNSTMVLARDVAYALPEISAFVLRRAKSIAEAALGQQVERAVITVPANFNDLQRASTKIAGKLAGLDVMRILNEPTAAALAYGQSISKAEKIAVFDLGGGTFDITLLDLTGNVFEVLATAGDTALGGDDIDRALAERIAIEVLRRHNVDPRMNPSSAARLMFMAEEIKKELSNAYQAQREINGVGYTQTGQPITMPFVMTRNDIEVLARPFVDRTIAVAKQSIEQIGLKPQHFDRVILVGGSTRMPLVGRAVEALFSQPPHLRVNPDEVVALGAAIQAHALNRSKSAHKRKSAHDQLAKAQPKTGEQSPTRPPEADPNLGATPAVPKAPKAPELPSLGTPQAPEFFTFNKAPAVISFDSRPAPPMPPAEAQTNAPRPTAPQPPRPSGTTTAAQKPPSPPAKKPPPPVPQKPPPPVPMQKPRTATVPFDPQAVNAGAGLPPLGPSVHDERTVAVKSDGRQAPSKKPSIKEDGDELQVTEGTLVIPPAAQGRGQSDHASGVTRGSGGSGRPIQGISARSPIEDAPLGPKPARSVVPPAAASVSGRAPAIQPGPTDIIAAPNFDFDLALPSGPPPGSRPNRGIGAAASLAEPTYGGFDLGGNEMSNDDIVPPPAPGGGDDLLAGLKLGAGIGLELDAKIPAFTPERFQQGSAIATSATTPLLIDVTPLSLGVETVGGYADVLIPANSPVPCEKTRTFMTASDGQQMVSIRVAQGESSRFAQNTRLGDLELSGLRPARRGEVKVVVTFELDADGILNVRARDQDTGRETTATLRLLGASTDAEDAAAMAERQARHVVA